MAFGDVTLNVQDGKLGIIPDSTDNIFVTLGACSLGTANTLYAFTDKNTLSATCGTGPAVEAVAMKLDVAGGIQYLMPINTSVAGAAGSVTATRVGSSDGTVTVSGAAKDSYEVVVTITSTGTGQLVSGGNVTATISLDNGNTVSAPVAIAVGGSYVIAGTGLTLAFSVSATTFDKGDVFTFTCTAPYWSTTDLNNAFTALFLDSRTWGMAHVVGFSESSTSSAKASNSASVATAVATQMASAATNKRYARAIVEAPPGASDADITAAFATFADTRVMVIGGDGYFVSPLTGRQQKRHAAHVYAARLAKARISESPGWVAAGNLLGVVSINRDERKTPAFEAARIACLGTILGKPGVFADFGVTMAAAGSDYSSIMNGRVMDAFCKALYEALLPYVNSSVLVNSNGTILEEEARGIDADVEGKARAAVVQPGNATDCSFRISRTNNVLSTRQLQYEFTVTPLGYAKSITGTVGFLNVNAVIA